MRRWYAIALLAGCSFDHGTASGATDSGGVLVDSEPLPCAMQRVWAADFTIDPTTLNLNPEPGPDWRIREGGALPGLLADGVWSIAGTPTVSLDTQPKRDFNRRTRATARLRNTSSAGARGAMVWLNVDYSPMTFMPLYLEVRLDPDGQHQTATLYGKDATTEIVIATFPGRGTGMVDIVIDIDPMLNSLTVNVDADSLTAGYTPIPRNMNDDRFATLTAYGSDAEFDAVRIETCM